MGSPRQEYWSGLPFPSPGDVPTQGSNPHLLHWQVDASLLSPHQYIFSCVVFSRFYSPEDSTGAPHSALMMKSRLLEATPPGYTWFPLIFTIPGRKCYCVHESDEETEAQGGEKRTARGGKAGEGDCGGHISCFVHLLGVSGQADSQEPCPRPPDHSLPPRKRTRGRTRLATGISASR